ncbi:MULTISPECIES: hypothetical protein [Bacillus]|uniref:hypothetical protein n=1 Tax=Bacillus TaxID=1386 RepID=UPI000473D5D1|nr:hypothetical protein [Bacillus cereus]ANE86588.1 hypothetical protein DA68_13335 [Bacillus cereus]MBY0015008.1 hypothetical protein [Bacillus cereus]MDA2057521.1 hypothetical protein [Bacillus cereus]MDZ4412925.1 hypothetical protein [Bacillus cereus]MDZ4502293.1 hypothetical protein [Bacillus cereus]
MIEIIAALFSLVAYSIIYLFSTEEDKKKAKADLKELCAGTDGQVLLDAAIGFGILIIIFGYIIMTQ